MIRVAILLFLCVIATSNEDGDWLKCKPKPGCSIARCDPPPGHWFENLDKLNDYSILCQPSEDTGAATNYANVLEKLTKLEGRLERSEREGSEMRVEMKILERENSRMKNQMEEEVNDLRKEMKMLEKENARIKSQMEEIESRNEKDSFSAALTSTAPYVLSTKDLTTSRTTETTTKGSCAITFNGICYWIHVQENVNFERAEEICSNKASTLAHFPTEEVYNAVFEDLRSKIPSERNAVNVWTGVTINTNTGNVIHPSGDTYAKWSPNWPRISRGYRTWTHVLLVADSNPSYTNQGMLNVSPHSSYHGAVCQSVE